MKTLKERKNLRSTEKAINTGNYRRALVDNAILNNLTEKSMKKQRMLKKVLQDRCMLRGISTSITMAIRKYLII